MFCAYAVPCLIKWEKATSLEIILNVYVYNVLTFVLVDSVTDLEGV